MGRQRARELPGFSELFGDKVHGVQAGYFPPRAMPIESLLTKFGYFARRNQAPYVGISKFEYGRNEKKRLEGGGFGECPPLIKEIQNFPCLTLS